MTFLSLAKGDPTARKMLNEAIRARYGVRPISPSSLQLDMETPIRGLFGLQTRRTVRLRMVGNTHRRWDQIDKLIGIKTGELTESYDGGTLYLRKGAATQSISDAKLVQGIRNLIWVELALFLTPLTDEGVSLKTLDTTTLQASSLTNPTEQATLIFNADYTLKSVEGLCAQANHPMPLKLTLRPLEGLRAINGFAVPIKIAYDWENEPSMTYTISNAEADLKIPLTEFSLG